MRNSGGANTLVANDVIAKAREFIPDKLYFTWLPSLPAQTDKVHFFTVDDKLIYAPFFSDFGPNSMAQVSRFCEILKDKLTKPAYLNKKICLVSGLDGDKKANAAFLIATYMMFVEGKDPEEAWAPMAYDFHQQLPPYRDAGYGQATFWLTIPDILRGLHKALNHGLLHLSTFDREEYEFFERVENGDFNWICDKFIAIASPHDERTTAQNGHIRLQRTPQSSIVDLFAAREATVNASLDTLVGGASKGDVSNSMWGVGRRRRDGRQLYSCYRVEDLISYFQEYGVAAMVRLNNRLYDRTRFLESGINHHELYFPDGTTPPESILRRFLEIAESTPGPIAVHCKAGLGRTGSLIACYLMKHYLFTAPEVIGFLRVLRPGSIVGPQQNWLLSMQPRMWKLHPSAPLPGHISMLREPSFFAVSSRTSDAIRAMERMASELDVLTDNMDVDAEVAKLAVPRQPRKSSAGTPVGKGPLRKSKSQQMHDNALHSLESLQLAPHKVVKPGKVRPAPRIDTAVTKPVQPTSASSGGTLVGSTPTSAVAGRVYTLRNYISGALGFGNSNSESK